jgi:hypothetical protein
LSQPFSPRETRAKSRWLGLALAAVGLSLIAAGAAIFGQSPLARWIINEILTPVNVLPLIALGVALALIGARAMVAALILFILGIGGGLFGEDTLLRLLDTIPAAATHLFLTGPISYLAAGAALVVSARWRMFVAPPAAAVFGAMVGVSIRLADPSLHEPAYTWTPALIALWIVLTVALSLRDLWRNRLLVFGRIFGSWVIAIGLLYGGASLIPKKASPPPAVALPPPSFPGDEVAIPALPPPQQSPIFPGRQPLRQP